MTLSRWLVVYLVLWRTLAVVVAVTFAVSALLGDEVSTERYVTLIVLTLLGGDVVELRLRGHVTDSDRGGTR